VNSREPSVFTWQAFRHIPVDHRPVLQLVTQHFQLDGWMPIDCSLAIATAASDARHSCWLRSVKASGNQEADTGVFVNNLDRGWQSASRQSDSALLI
jgi:hypothetical protein